ncbi:MAG: OsmC family protein [Chlamydiales bacterium]|nr:OsmC family protein [Chlamydiales bacterium]
MHVLYEGDLHTVVTHEPSGQRLHTDAPIDNKGKGETFSPTDLIGASVASCIATVIGVYAERKGWDLRGMRLSVEKTMSTDAPRRIVSLSVEIWMPISIEEKEKEKLEKIALTCPVHNSLRQEIEKPVIFHWKE